MALSGGGGCPVTWEFRKMSCYGPMTVTRRLSGCERVRGICTTVAGPIVVFHQPVSVIRLGAAAIARSCCGIPAGGLLGAAAAITAAIGRCELSVE